MNAVAHMPELTPFEALVDYERRSLAHVAGTPELVDAPGVWRGIAFRCGARYLVSGIAEIGEILALPQVASIPGTKRWLLGIANVRGNLIPVVDLRDYIEGERTFPSEASRVMLVRQPGGQVGLLIDEVVGQRGFSEHQRESARGESDERYAPFVGEVVALGGEDWGLFSMSELVRTPDFQSAAA